MNQSFNALSLLVEACQTRKLLLVWADTPFPPQETLRQPAASLINQWQSAVAQCAPLPWGQAVLPSLPVLSLDSTARLEAAASDAATVVTLRDVVAQGRPTVLKLAGDLASRAGLFLTWDDVRAARNDRDKAHILREAAHIAASGVVLVLSQNPGPTFDRFWTTLLALALCDAAHLLALGPPDYPWPAPLACIGPIDDATAIFSHLQAVIPIVPHRPTQPEGTQRDAVEFADLEIHILPRRGEAYPVDLTLNGQNNWRGQVQAADLPWIKTGDDAEDGTRLFNVMFADDALRTGWAEARALSPQRHTRLRLWLDVDEPQLHALPWELLHDGKTFLAAGDDTPFSRYLPVDAPWGVAAEPPIRVLAAIANPADLAAYNLITLDVAAERRRLEEALAVLPATSQQLVFLDAPVTLERLETALREQRPHILHIVAHGAFSDRREQTVLYLQADDSAARLVADADFSGIFHRLGQERPRLVFLAACESASRSTVDAFAGLAPQIVRAGVPAVVAMQDTVAITATKTLTTSFYRQLIRHGEVDRALNAARSLLLAGESPDAGAPVLLMRLKDGRLWAADAGGPSTAASQGAVYNITIQNATGFAIGDGAQALQGAPTALAASTAAASTAPPPSVSNLRALLHPLDDVQIETLCLDHFPDVYDRFSRGMRRDEKINLLLDHIRRRPAEAARLTELLRGML